MANKSGSSDHFESVDQGVRSARAVLLTVNVICAFLFLMVFELVLGWQSFRGSASRYIYSENIALLAKVANTTDWKLNSRDSLVIATAARYVEHLVPNWKETKDLREVIKDTLSTKDLRDPIQDTLSSKSLREVIQETLSKDSIWYQEERIRTFAEDITIALKDSLLSIQNDSIAVIPRNERISYHLQEILDRFQVIEETRSRRVSRREYNFPIIGTMMQIEDILLPVATFLLLLTFWLYTASMRAFNSARSFIHQLHDEYDSAMGLPRREMNHTTSENVAPFDLRYFVDQITRLVNRFQFMRMRVMESYPTKRGGRLWNRFKKFTSGRKFDVLWSTSEIALKDESRRPKHQLARRMPTPDLSIVWLFLAPYLVVTSGVLANLHETFIIDIRWHGSSFAWESSTLNVFILTSALVLACAAYLCRIAFKLRNGFLKVSLRCTVLWEKMRTAHADTESVGVDIRSYRAARAWYTDPATFGWIAASPFVVFGTLTSLYVNNMLFTTQYFPGLYGSAGYLGALAIYAFFSRHVMSRRSPGWKRKLGLLYLFVVLPALHLFVLIDSWSGAGHFGHRPLYPIVFTLAGLVTIGFIFRGYRLLFSQPDRQF